MLMSRRNRNKSLIMTASDILLMLIYNLETTTAHTVQGDPIVVIYTNLCGLLDIDITMECAVVESKIKSTRDQNSQNIFMIPKCFGVRQPKFRQTNRQTVNQYYWKPLGTRSNFTINS